MGSQCKLLIRTVSVLRDMFSISCGGGWYAKVDSANEAGTGMKLLPSRNLGGLLGVTKVVFQQTIPESGML